ncbi:MAG: pyruvate, phosphate dikinase [Bacteroidales bacterium]|jgi:hypothetical protein|nr:pyruvate, phosphate dikinase [Bacteroidales bacterium]
MKYNSKNSNNHENNRQILETLTGVNKIAAVLREGRPPVEALAQIALLLPNVFEVSHDIAAKIEFGSDTFYSHDFQESVSMLLETFPAYDYSSCSITIYRKPLNRHSSPFFTPQEKELFSAVVYIIKRFYMPQQEPEEIDMSMEQLKELAAINRLTRIIREKKPIPETFEQICEILPRAWRHPRHARAKITFKSRVFYSDRFVETGWRMSEEFKTTDNDKGKIEIFYLKELPVADDGPFLKQEKHLLRHVAKMLTAYLNGMDLNDLNYETNRKDGDGAHSVFNSRQLLQRSLNNQNYGREIFHDLMPFKVREILLIANLYDVYSVESEGRTTQHILGGFYEFGVSDVPRITGVSTKEDAMEWLRSKHFDVVIMMMGVDKSFHIEVSREIRRKFPYMPIYMLLNNKDLARFEQEEQSEHDEINKIYIWNGDPKIFYAMIKNLEDRVNVENDSKIGQVQVILLVEDSPQYYSRYMPVLYTAVMDQTQLLLDKTDSNLMEKLIRLRARPKILHAANYEDALDIYYKYHENLLCAISDVRFWKNGILDEKAGFRLVEQIRRQNPYLPIVMQSSDVSNETYARQLKTVFIHKHSETLIQDVKNFINSYLGFGDFIFKDESGNAIYTATTMLEFEETVKIIPDSSLTYHAKWNHFSIWFMARGEIQIARILQAYQLEDFTEPNALRNFLLDAISRHRSEQAKGKVIPFEEIDRYDSQNIASMYSGSFGGKGRGLAFINNLFVNIDLSRIVPGINIRTPRTFMIGSDAFLDFLKENKLNALYGEEWGDDKIKKRFMKAKLPVSLRKKIKKLATITDKPLAVRSSGLFEDSLMRPFSGIFETYLIPFSSHDIDERVKQCEDAIKMVYASVFVHSAKDYIRAVNYKIEDEQMAIVIQEVVGRQYERYFYPHISGVAQSYNYYPVGHSNPEDGFALLALGLGNYVVGGEKTYRFSPKYPGTDIYSVEDLLRTTQNYFYAIDLNKTNIDLIEGEESGLEKLDVEMAKKHGTIRHLASIFDVNNNVLTPGIDRQGLIVLNFANILKYNYIPLADTINAMLAIMKEAMGSPVEIEFAVDMTKDDEGKATFYLLQIKPLLSSSLDCNIDVSKLNRENSLLYADKGMGNGTIEDIVDVVVVDPDLFDKINTEQIASEVDVLNKKLVEENRNYVLIGPGRWGTRDRFIGIPVMWSQISNAKLIVETSLESFPLDGSYGSHFFHNVTAMNIGYYSIQHMSKDNFINWELLKKQSLVEATKYCKHYRFKKPIMIRMDGKKRLGVIEIMP